MTEHFVSAIYRYSSSLFWRSIFFVEAAAVKPASLARSTSCCKLSWFHCCRGSVAVRFWKMEEVGGLSLGEAASVVVVLVISFYPSVEQSKSHYNIYPVRNQSHDSGLIFFFSSEKAQQRQLWLAWQPDTNRLTDRQDVFSSSASSLYFKSLWSVLRCWCCCCCYCYILFSHIRIDECHYIFPFQPTCLRTEVKSVGRNCVQSILTASQWNTKWRLAEHCCCCFCCFFFLSWNQ